jgi:CheY-like chemotaxis protein/HPt (histidine-containing phosphotransfer) domain-containing protein
MAITLTPTLPVNLAVVLFSQMSNGDHPIRLLLVEDDELSRELLALQVAAHGYQVATADSGEAALLHLQQTQQGLPDAVLADLQMPGTSGLELARLLRLASNCPGTILLAMSASRPQQDLSGAYDGFLLKPFTMEQLAEALEQPAEALTSRSAAAPGAPEDPWPDSAEAADPSLDAVVYQQLSSSIPAAQLQQLYALCINDAETRIGRMRLAATDDDNATYRQQAHAIKGGCGLVGAAQLRRLAAAAEERGIAPANHSASLDEMLAACRRLRRILIAHEYRATS